jgi:hypothetical protein
LLREVPWTLTVRVGPRVSRERFDAPGPALDALARRLDEVGPLRTARALTREYEPAEQVAARGEIRGPGRLLPSVRAGADVRGDGTVEAWTGWLRRTAVEPLAGEDAMAALHRVIGA